MSAARRLFERPVADLNRDVTAGREEFLAAGSVAGVRPVIAASWERTRALGIAPTAERAPSIISLDQIDEILRTETLGLSGRQVLDRFAGLVEGSGHVIVLADDRGRILYEVGHRNVYEALDAINFVPGGHWCEQAVGPNGIGTPLNLGRPELVLGAEHFCDGWKPWVCYGAPVFDPDSGLPMGVVDITGPSGAADLQTLALTVSIAQSLEQQLELVSLHNRDMLRSGFRDIEKRWPGDALLLLSDAGRVVETNRVAAGALGLDGSVHLERPLADVLPDLWLLVRDLVQSGRFGQRDGEVQLADGAAPTLSCRVQPVHRDERKVGAVLVISGFHRLSGSRRPAPPRAARELTQLADIVGDSPLLHDARRLAELAAADDVHPVLLLGETGTGKEMFAQGIHVAGPRRTRPFVAINCGALPRDLAESELFGHAPGAFTGARAKGHAGKFEVADGGTLFLDEIDSLDADIQGKLLRVLEDFQVCRVGDHVARAVDVRVIAAGRPDLPARVEAGEFRRDLFHRLNVIDIALPSLRDRRHDIGSLARHFVAQECARRGVPAPRLDEATLACLSAYDWPGNVRELLNLCRRLLLTARGDAIMRTDLPPEFATTDVGGAAVAGEQPVDAAARSLRTISDDAIRDAVAAADGNVAEAARRLGINRTTIYRRRQGWDDT